MQLRPRENLRKADRYSDYATAYFGAIDIDEPKNYEDAMKSQHATEWEKAIERELLALKDSDTWTVVDKPVKCNEIDSKWVFKVKKNEYNEITQFKARLVARGFQQKGLQYDDIYAPVAKLQTFRILLAVIVNLDCTIYQMDVCNAFLHGYIEVYMSPPKNCYLPKDKTCRLNKSIYGLKKAHKNWYKRFDSFMKDNLFEKPKSDYCLHIKAEQNERIYILIFVDDLIITGSSEDKVNKLKIDLSNAFKMKDLGGTVSYYIGISVHQDIENGVVTLDQENYLQNVLDRFGMLNCKGSFTPMDKNFDQNLLIKEKSESSELESKCRQAIGSIMYAVLG
ncbi:hypothetical protein B7P43_G18365, partial [Cryptotermes secundus]